MKYRIAALFLIFAGASPAGADTGVLFNMGRELAALAEDVTPGVVQIMTERDSRLGSRMRARRETGGRVFLGWPAVKSSGSGFLIDSEGHVITTSHVVEGAEKIIVRLWDGSETEAELKGLDAAVNVALLKVEAPRLRGLALGNSADLKPGTPVITVSNPFGFLRSVHWGVVGGVARRGLGISEIEDFIQLNSSVNPGDSGAPVIDSRGEVVGVLVASLGSVREMDARPAGPRGEGIAFAIPIEMVKHLIPRLKAGEKIEHGWLGIGIQELSPLLGEEFKVADGKGVLVAMVVEGGPAGRAGIREGDVIRALDRTPVETPSDLLSLVSRSRIGRKLDLSFLREGTRESVKITVAPRRAERGVPAKETGTGPLGLRIKEILRASGGAPDKLRKEGCLVVTGVERGSPAGRAGLREDDVICGVNRKPVASRSDWDSLTAGAKSGRKFLIRTQRGFFVIKVD